VPFDLATFWIAPIRRRPPSRACARLDHRPTNHQVELRLTANLQLQRPCNPSFDVRSRGPVPSSDSSTARFRVGSRSKTPLAPCFPTAASSTARRACSVASDALCRDHPLEPDLSIGPGLLAARLRLRRRLVKDSCFTRARTPSSDECALPRDQRVSDMQLAPHSGRFQPRLSPLSPLRLAPLRGTGSSRTRHRTPGFAAAGRLRAPPSPGTPPQDCSRDRATG